MAQILFWCLHFSVLGRASVKTYDEYLQMCYIDSINIFNEEFHALFSFL